MTNEEPQGPLAPQQIILTRGIPASGKSTVAKGWVAEDPDWRVRINRDDTRKMTVDKFWGLSRHQEETMTLLQVAQAQAAVGAKLSVIVDDTNLRAKTVKTWLEVGLELNVPVHHIDVWVDVEEAVRRDLARDRVVGEEVIRDFYKRFMQKNKFPAWPVLDLAAPRGRAYTPDPSKPKAVWIDVDGTLAKMVGRGAFDWHRVEEDEPWQHIIDIVHALKAAGYKCVIMSGRDEASREGTQRWLVKHGVPVDDMFMRPAGSMEPDWQIKHDLFWEFVAPKYNVQFALDDRDQVVKFTREVLGIPVLQVAPGAF